MPRKMHTSQFASKWLGASHTNQVESLHVKIRYKYLMLFTAQSQIGLQAGKHHDKSTFLGSNSKIMPLALNHRAISILLSYEAALQCSDKAFDDPKAWFSLEL